ncbi:hypothetical protein D3C80_1766100 [compost metagenome]
MGVEDGVHGRHVALARRIPPGLGRAQRPQLQIIHPLRLQALAQQRLGKARDARRGDGAHVGHDLDPGVLQPVDDLGLGRTFIADSEQLHPASIERKPPSAKPCAQPGYGRSLRLAATDFHKPEAQGQPEQGPASVT